MGAIRDAAVALATSHRKSIPDAIKRFVWKVSPLEFSYDPPVGQVFIADDVFDTYLCFNNFYSVLVPEVPVAATVKVDFHDPTGRIVHRHALELAPHGSEALSVREVMREAGINCPVGLAAADIRPARVPSGERERFKAMGRVASHFFTYYLDTTSEAMAIIHPQSVVGQKETGREHRGWRSGQTIVTAGLEGLSLYQANHAEEACEVTYEICEVGTDRVVATKTRSFPAISADVVDFDAKELTGTPSHVYLRTNRLPSPNGKPLLMRRYPGRRFSMSHS